MSGLIRILRFVDERLITGFQVAAAQFFQLVPALISFQMTGSLHRHALVWIFWCGLSLLWAQGGEPILAPALAGPDAAIAGYLENWQIGFQWFNVAGILLVAFAVFPGRAHRELARKRSTILLGAVGFFLALVSVLTEDFLVFAVAQIAFVLVIAFSYGTTAPIGHHARCVSFLVSQFIAAILLTLGGIGFVWVKTSAIPIQTFALLGAFLRAGIFPLHYWSVENSNLQLNPQGLMRLYTVSGWPMAIFCLLDFTASSGLGANIVLLLVLAFGATALGARLWGHDTKNYGSKLVFSLVGTVILLAVFITGLI